MRTIHFASLLSFFALTVLLVPAPARACTDIHASVAAATSEDPAKAGPAIRQLRLMGQGALDLLIKANQEAIERHVANPAEKDPSWCRIASAIDTVAAQKDAWASGLYWFTDLERAKTAAAAQHKPILSLRLLGTLDTDFSCANSRFFRTALYANKGVSKYLKENYILHWKSVRPVPKVTIDFGDGRVVERTITGNSIHYVLDSDGTVMDGIPGLYGPAAFLKHLELVRKVQQQLDGKDAAFRDRTLARWHLNAAEQIRLAWMQDLAAIGSPVALPEADALNAAAAARQVPVARPPAIRAAPIAVGKARVEMKLVKALTPSAEQLASTTGDAQWEKIAALHAEQAKLDAGSRSVIVSKNPNAAVAGVLAFAKYKTEDPLVRVVRNFEHSMAVDTVRNEYLFHRQIHQWLGQKAEAVALDTLNERVYAELFLTPSSDPWLGLVPVDAYSALENEGIRK